jgi:hypothetical protein
VRQKLTEPQKRVYSCVDQIPRTTDEVALRVALFHHRGEPLFVARFIKGGVRGRLIALKKRGLIVGEQTGPRHMTEWKRPAALGEEATG